MYNRNNINYIKTFMKNVNNGLLIVDRQSGKTQALLELLNEDKFCYILTCSYDSKNRLVKAYKNLFEDDGYIRIFHYNDIQDKKIQTKDCYIDEYFFHPICYNIFKGAVSSMRFPVKIIRLNKLTIEDDKQKLLSDKQFKLEYSLDF